MDSRINKINLRSFLLRIPIAILIFCLAYYGFLFLISASVEQGRFYHPFFANYFNLPDIWRVLLFKISQFVLSIFGFQSSVNGYFIRIEGGAGASLVFSCLAYFYHSLWFAIVFLFIRKAKSQINWILVGTVFLFFLNVSRIVGLLLIINGGNKKIMLGIDHHYFFDFFALFLIILLSVMSLKLNLARSEG
jgi:exosortase/archaeosortase family protein